MQVGWSPVIARSIDVLGEHLDITKPASTGTEALMPTSAKPNKTMKDDDEETSDTVVAHRDIVRVNNHVTVFLTSQFVSFDDLIITINSGNEETIISLFISNPTDNKNVPNIIAVISALRDKNRKAKVNAMMMGSIDGAAYAALICSCDQVFVHPYLASLRISGITWVVYGKSASCRNAHEPIKFYEEEIGRILIERKLITMEDWARIIEDQDNVYLSGSKLVEKIKLSNSTEES